MKNFSCSFRNRRMPGWLLISLLIVQAFNTGAAERVSFCFNDWPPYTEMTKNGPDGISVEIVKQAARLVGIKIRFFKMNWNDCLEKVGLGELDAVMDAAERKEFLQGPTSFSSYTDTIWVRNNSGITHYDDLSGTEIGIVKGFKYTKGLFDLFERLNLKVVYGADDPTNIRNLAQGKFDSTVADLASTFAFVRQHKLRVHPILPPFSVDRLYISFNREKVELQRDFDRAFAELLKQGVVDRVYEQYIGVAYASFESTNSDTVK